MNHTDPNDIQGRSEPIKDAADSERRPPADPANGETKPRIAIAEALRNHWFEIWYQPKIDLKRKCLAGAEALARIRHPQLGILPPGSFLPDVDTQGVADLAQHALMATLCDWSMFEEAGFNLHLAVNIPVGVLPKLPIPAMIAQYRPKSDRWPGLIVEVTEDQIVRDLALAQKTAKQLQASGIKIAIDDFGAGYSSFSSLREFPFAELKVDRSFVV
ncbi:MAG: EAL domain-containing protein, partial [Xanthobacteraceae bacterium]